MIALDESAKLSKGPDVTDSAAVGIISASSADSLHPLPLTSGTPSFFGDSCE